MDVECLSIHEFREADRAIQKPAGTGLYSPGVRKSVYVYYVLAFSSDNL